MFQFSDCVGAVDETHVKVQKPRADPASFFDYKKDYSGHLQAVCYSKTLVLFHYIGASGRNNDGRVAEMRRFNNLLRSGRFLTNTTLLGILSSLYILLNRFIGIFLKPWEAATTSERVRMVI